MEVTKPVSSVLRLPPPRRDGSASTHFAAPGKSEVLVEDSRQFSQSNSQASTAKRLENSLTEHAAAVRKKYHTDDTSFQRPDTFAEYPSAAFLAQQIGQETGVSATLTRGQEYRDVSQAYRDTLRLTAFVVSHEGIRQKIV